MTPPGWENAPLSALAALSVAGDDADLFDQIKAELQGEDACATSGPPFATVEEAAAYIAGLTLAEYLAVVEGK